MDVKQAFIALAVGGVFALASLPATAQSPVYIGGGALFGGSGNFKDSISGANSGNDTGGSSFKLGYVLSGGHRIELSYSAIDLEFSSVTRQVTGLDVDFLWVLSDERLKPYFGFGAGAYTFEDSAFLFVGDKDLRGVALNLSGGLIYALAPNFELEAALRFKAIESQDVKAGAATGNWRQTMTNFFLGANLRF